MGVTLTVALAFWAASSYVEYRIIKAVPPMKQVFDHPLGGIVVSISIGIALGIALGPTVGVGAALGQILGLATNKFTYEMYQGGARFADMLKTKYMNLKRFFEDNQDTIAAAANTIRLGVKSLALLFLGFMFLVGLPFRAAERIQKMRHA